MRSYSIGNRLRRHAVHPCGEGTPTLILASIGTSSPKDDLAIELEKARVAEEAGAHGVTDHSFYGDLSDFHLAISQATSLLLSTVGCYEFAARARGHSFQALPSSEPIAILLQQAERGIDIITVHAALRRQHLAALAESKRLIPMTSKGGGIVSAYMRSTGAENPYYENFDQILEIFSQYDVTLSLGTSLRPASVCDHPDRLALLELEVMAELTERAAEMGVKVMIEGIGHASMDDIPFYVESAKHLCGGAPYRVLPVATDIALGYDHVAGAIGASVAVAAGADVVTCISRAEHIGLPTIEDLREAILATRVAVHCGELVKLRDYSRDRQMSQTRWEQGCKGDWSSAVNPAAAEDALRSRGRLDDQLIQCSMCGAYCGITAGISTQRDQRSRLLERRAVPSLKDGPGDGAPE